MSQEKMLELQCQMRQNQSELQSYLKDLDSWTSEVKETDEQLKTASETTTNDSDKKLPPVRNSLHKPRKKKKKAAESKTESKKPGEKQRISGFDFKAWDKFDVDAACAEVDEDADHSASDSSEYEVDEDWEHERRKQQAVLYKDQGNQMFKEGRHEEAIECYTRGIECDPENALLPANRAMALLKQDKFAAAVLDCTAAIILDPQYVKAHMRRGAARVGLERWSEARDDFKQVLKMEPGNKQAQRELIMVEKKLNPDSEEKSKVTSDSGIIKPIYKPPHLRSKKPLRRVKIEDIGGPQVAAPTSQSEATQKLSDQQGASFEQFVKPTPEDKMDFDNVQNTTDSGKLVPKATEKEKLPTPASSTESPTPPKVHAASTPRPVAPPPVTSYQFQAEWKVLRKTEEEFYQYFKQIPVSNYKRIFGDGLEADVLLKVFDILHKLYISNDEEVLPVLESLTEVKRFAVTVLFLSKSDKQVLHSIFKHLRSQHPDKSTVLNTLASKYDL